MVAEKSQSIFNWLNHPFLPIGNNKTVDQICPPICKCPQISSSNQGRTLSKVMPAEGRGGWMGLALGFGLATVHWFPTLGSNTGCFMQNYWNIRPLSSIKSIAFPNELEFTFCNRALHFWCNIVHFGASNSSLMICSRSFRCCLLEQL